jgi:uncharacterized protein YndB with AHSA1/START domain
MTPIAVSVDIDSPQEEVFAYVTDPSRFIEWQAGVERLEPGDTSGGLEWREEVVETTPGGRRQVKLQIAREAGIGTRDV